MGPITNLSTNNILIILQDNFIYLFIFKSRQSVYDPSLLDHNFKVIKFNGNFGGYYLIYTTF